MSDQFEMDLHTDPRGRLLLKIHDMTTEITDSMSYTDSSYVPVFEGYTAFETEKNSVRVYLVIAKGVRLLLYGVEVPSVPKRFMFSRTESHMFRNQKNVFSCTRIVMEHPDDIGYLLSGENDDEILSRKKLVPRKGESSEEFIQLNAIWLADPIVN